MATEEIRLLHEALRVSQERYNYFLLAVAASAIALSVQFTRDYSYTPALIPLGLAVLCWSGSFYSGCRRVEYVNSTIFANLTALVTEAGLNEEVGKNVHLIEAATRGIRQAAESNSESASNLGASQFRLLVLGGAFFIVWHLVEMGVRSSGGN